MTFLIGCSKNSDQNVVDDKTNNMPAVEEQVNMENEEDKEETLKLEDSESREDKSTKTEEANENQSLSKDELFDMITSNDMNSYKLNTEGKTEQVTANDDLILMDSYDSQVEFTKDPIAYHTFYHMNKPEAQIDVEYYSNGQTWVIRQDGGEWFEMPYEEGSEQMMADAKKQSDASLKSLKEYYTVEQTNSSYIVELVSSLENIDAIKDVILGTDSYQDLVGQPTYISYKHEYSKDGYHPMTFESVMEFTNNNGDITTISQNGEYKEVNQIDKIEFPEEIKPMFEK